MVGLFLQAPRFPDSLCFQQILNVKNVGTRQSSLFSLDERKAEAHQGRGRTCPAPHGFTRFSVRGNISELKSDGGRLEEYEQGTDGKDEFVAACFVPSLLLIVCLY